MANKCELNNATNEEHNRDMEENLNYVYRGAKVTALQKIKFTELKVFLNCLEFPVTCVS